MPLKHFTHDFNPRPPDPYAKERLFKAAKELGYVVIKKEATATDLRDAVKTLIEQGVFDEDVEEVAKATAFLSDWLNEPN